jgi:arylformamidase
MAHQSDDYRLDMVSATTQAVLADYAERSRAVCEHAGAHLDQPYGAGPAELLDIFVPPNVDGAPLVAFLHGGWWRAGDRRDRAFLAQHFLSRGIGFASIGYPLAPDHTLPALVDSAVAAVGWLHRNALRLGFDPTRLLLSGNSAGGHLAAIAGSADRLAAAGLPHDAVAGIYAISGLYDLSQLVGTFADEWLALDARIIADCSPVHHLPAPGVPVWLAVGGDEPRGFRAQMAAYAEVLKSAGRPCRTEVLAGHSHFTVVAELGRPCASPFETVLSMCRRQAVHQV